MRLVSFCREKNGSDMEDTHFYHHPERNEEVGLVLPCGRILPVSSMNESIVTMNDLIDIWNTDAGRELREVVSKFTEEKVKAAFGSTVLEPDQVKILAPIPHPKQDVLCLGLNYRAHNAEAATFLDTEKEAPPKAVYFAKRAWTIFGPEDEIPAHADVTNALDYEAELAVVMGSDAYDVDPQNALDYVFGYAVFNDVSARDLQKSRGQWYLGKSLYGHTVMGPAIVTADEWNPGQKISCHVNGELRQEANTADMIVTVEAAISELSHTMGLERGSIIAMGTPAGVAMGMEHPVYLKKGDIVRCEIEGIGVLENRVGETRMR